MRLRVLATAAAVALVTPGSAAAHVRTSSPAVDYEVRVAPLRGPLAGAASVRVYRTDLAIRLAALAGRRIVVLGYLGEPFLRFARGAVSVNPGSLTAKGSGLAADLPVFLHGLVLSATPGNVARTAVALAIAAGGAATVVGSFVFFDVVAHYEEPSSTERYL